MNTRIVIRLVLVALSVLVTTSCAHASGGDLGAPREGSSAICDLRVESAYDVPIEAGVLAGPEEVSLGTLGPRESVGIGVPCSYGAVTVFRRIERDGPGGAARLASRTQALDPRRTTTVIVRPPVNRAHPRPRG